MIRLKLNIIYPLMAIGVALTFFGHGVLAMKSDEKFIGLVTGSYDKVLGGTMSVDTATSIVNVVGVMDVVLALVFGALAFAAWREHHIAFSPLAIALFGWAALWGFLTALSRFTAVLNGAEVWDVVERGPNFILPLAVLYVIHLARTQESPATSQRSSVETGRSEGPAPTPA